MKVLVACEFSGVVRDAFLVRGHDAWSCDLLPSDSGYFHGGRKHYQCDVRDVVQQGGWDLMIAHPPCTYVCSSGMHWTRRGLRDPKLTEDAVEFVTFLLGCGIPRIALENPVGILSTRIRKPDQIIQPWQFGHPESKATCLWLKNLPPLLPTKVLSLPASGRWNNQTPSGQNKLGPSADRWAKRSVTYSGIASAMAEQWGTQHDYRTCKVEDCEECESLVSHGLVLACDECDTPGSTDSAGWHLMKDGRTLCEQCFANVKAADQARPKSEAPMGHNNR